MNRKLLALAVGSVMAMPLAAQAAPTVYGLMNLSVDRTVDTVADEILAVDVDQFDALRTGVDRGTARSAPPRATRAVT